MGQKFVYGDYESIKKLQSDAAAKDQRIAELEAAGDALAQKIAETEWACWDERANAYCPHCGWNRQLGHAPTCTVVSALSAWRKARTK